MALQSSSIYVCQTQMRHEREIWATRAFLHTIWCRRVELYSCSSCFGSPGHFLDYSDGIAPIHCLIVLQASTRDVCQTQMRHEREIWATRAFLHTIWCRRVELYSCSSCFASPGHFFDYSDGIAPIHC